jgi:hypothetical protein
MSGRYYLRLCVSKISGDGDGGGIVESRRNTELTEEHGILDEVLHAGIPAPNTMKMVLLNVIPAFAGMTI